METRSQMPATIISRTIKVLMALLFMFTLCLPAWADTMPLVTSEGDIFANLGLPVYVWSNGNRSPDAIVIGLHGGCLHGRAFDYLGHQLANEDILFVSLDMRGYGSWFHEDFGERKDRTFDYAQSRRDIQTVLKRLHEVFPQTPVFALGESVGANMAIVLAADKPELLNGLVLISPSSAIRFFMSPDMIVRGLHGISVPLGKVNIKGVLRNRLAHKEEIALEHLSDPLGRDYQSLLELSRSWRLNLKAMREARKVPAEMPILVFVGAKDLLCNTKMTLVMFDQLKSADKQLIVLPETGHLMVETAFADEKTIDMILSWVRQHGRSKTACTLLLRPEENMTMDSPRAEAP